MVANFTPCDASVTVSCSGQRVAVMRRRSSAISSCGKLVLKGRMDDTDAVDMASPLFYPMFNVGGPNRVDFVWNTRRSRVRRSIVGCLGRNDATLARSEAREPRNLGSAQGHERPSGIVGGSRPQQRIARYRGYYT